MSDCYTTSDEFDLCDATSEEESDSLNDVEGEAIATVMSSQQKELSDSFSINRNKHNKTSPVWNFMSEEKEGDKVIARICGKCGQKFSPTTTTGVLSNHLSNKHDIELIQKPYGKGDVRHKKEARYDLVAKELRSLTSKVVLIADIWTSISNQAYLCVTVHYIDDKWQMRQLLLAFIHFEHNHTAIRTKEKLYELCDAMNISDKIIALTTDNYSAMVLCGSLIMLHRFKKMRNELSLLVTVHKKQLESAYPNDKEWEVKDIMLMTFPFGNQKDAALTSLRNVMSQYNSQTPTATTTTPTLKSA
ncbi:5255_t:CDS:2, partial [Racocetra fulgida]